MNSSRASIRPTELAHSVFDSWVNVTATLYGSGQHCTCAGTAVPTSTRSASEDPGNAQRSADSGSCKCADCSVGVYRQGHPELGEFRACSKLPCSGEGANCWAMTGNFAILQITNALPTVESCVFRCAKSSAVAHQIQQCCYLVQITSRSPPSVAGAACKQDSQDSQDIQTVWEASETRDFRGLAAGFSS